MSNAEMNFTDEAAKAFLLREHEGVAKGNEGRERLRNQLKALTISVAVTFLGLAIDSSHLTMSILLSVPVFCLFMHALDTMLLDMNKRQEEYGKKVTSSLLEFDALSAEGKRRAVAEINSDPKKTPWTEKVSLFFHAGLFDSLWHWGLFFGTLFVMLKLPTGSSFRNQPATSSHQKVVDGIHLDSIYTPTRKEWIELVVAEAIEATLDLWDTRYGVMVAYAEKDSTLWVTISHANWEEEPTQEKKQWTVTWVEGIVEKALNRYPWSARLNRKVQFVL